MTRHLKSSFAPVLKHSAERRPRGRRSPTTPPTFAVCWRVAVTGGKLFPPFLVASDVLYGIVLPMEASRTCHLEFEKLLSPSSSGSLTRLSPIGMNATDGAPGVRPRSNRIGG